MTQLTTRRHRTFGLLLATMALSAGAACLAAPRTITVDPSGHGDYTTLQAAITSVPDSSVDRTIIHIKPGTYQGPFVVPTNKDKITFEGDDAAKTILTYDRNVKDPIPPGINDFNPGVQIQANDFTADNITFQNTSGDHGQALALRVDGDREIFRHCRMLGWQDTLMVNNGRSYFDQCDIEGRVDFIYGSGTAWFEQCEIYSKNGGHVTAASTPQDHPYGFVFHDCRLTGDPNPWVAPGGIPANVSQNPQADLGRPWRPYASVTYLHCWMGGQIKPEGWNNWGKTSNEQTARYSEYDSTGPGANPTARAPWSHQLTKAQADAITVHAVLSDGDGWDPTQPHPDALLPTPAAAPPVPKPSVVLNLWPGDPPNMVPGAGPGADDGTGRFRNVGIPGMYVYLPSKGVGGKHRIALICCTGGGYTHETRMLGADSAAATFTPRGVVVISLKYRLAPPSTDVEADALADAERAVQLVRSHARAWGVDPNKVGVLGWSAGANMALNIASHYAQDPPAQVDTASRFSDRPNFVVMLSPWPDKHPLSAYPIHKASPPAFIGSALDDHVAPVTFAEGIAQEYRQLGVPVKLMLVPTGDHGAYTIGGTSPGHVWPSVLWAWLKTTGIRS